MNRDMNPHKAARAAMWLYGADYAASGLGSMGYWYSLSKYRQAMCRQMVSEIGRARTEESNAKLTGDSFTVQCDYRTASKKGSKVV